MAGKFDDPQKVLTFKSLQGIVPTQLLLREIFDYSDEEAANIMKGMELEYLTKESRYLEIRLQELIGKKN